eukprot:6172550-Pleurochrysis_carterae.AAC.1
MQIKTAHGTRSVQRELHGGRMPACISTLRHFVKPCMGDGRGRTLTNATPRGRGGARSVSTAALRLLSSCGDMHERRYKGT